MLFKLILMNLEVTERNKNSNNPASLIAQAFSFLGLCNGFLKEL